MKTAEEIREEIKCPECGVIQEAKVIKSIPFDIYIHNCVECNYCIMESEWVKEK